MFCGVCVMGLFLESRSLLRGAGLASIGQRTARVQSRYSLVESASGVPKLASGTGQQDLKADQDNKVCVRYLVVLMFTVLAAIFCSHCAFSVDSPFL